jgi:hypothetical protein
MVGTSFLCNSQSQLLIVCNKVNEEVFTKEELRTLLTANYYSVLFYNSEIWHIPSLNPNSKQHLLAVSARALLVHKNDSSVLHSYIDRPPQNHQTCGP